MDIGQTLAIESLNFHLVNPWELNLAGSLSSAAAQGDFAKRLDELHADLASRKVSSFMVDVRSLSFVNSSAIRVFVNWISLAERAAYKIVFITDDQITWHRLSFSVLKSLAPATVEIRSARERGP